MAEAHQNNAEPEPRPLREFFYRISRAGELFHAGTKLEDPAALRTFFRLLQVNTGKYAAEYPWVSPCGPEQNYLQAEDTALVFTRLVNSAGEADDLAASMQQAEARLEYAPGLALDFQPWTLRFGADGVLYHPAPQKLGGMARLSRTCALELAPRIEAWGPFYCLEWGGREHVIQPIEPEYNGRLLQPRLENACYGCGRAHPIGPALTFLWDAETTEVRSWFKAGVNMQGRVGWMHGGFISLLLDEVMGKALSANDMRGAPTAGLNVRFRCPVQLNKRLLLLGRFERVEGRKHFVHGEIRSLPTESNATIDGGLLLAEADGVFVRPRTADS